MSAEDIQGSRDAPENLQKISNFSSIEEFTKHGMSLILEATKVVSALPHGAVRDMYCAYPSFGRIVDKQSHNILGIVSKVLQKQNIMGNIQWRQKDEQFELLLECNDVMLERINSNLDELSGITRSVEPNNINKFIYSNENSVIESGSWHKSNRKFDETTEKLKRLLATKSKTKPQDNFKHTVDNNPLVPFEPKIKYKPNSLKPLAILPEYDEDGNISSYLHPYEFELMKFEPPLVQLRKENIEQFKPIEDTPLIFIDNIDKLQNLILELRNESIIAVDVEHHSFRTFQGITCLIQISTKEKDYIIDTLELRDELNILNEIFTDTKILKVFHGADLDVLWLQRDFSIYIVNMFDTHQAAKLLNFPRLSLAYLLKHYCKIEVDKTLQLADWRLRPLPQELMNYARTDTHYLIFVYESIRNDLISLRNGEANILKVCYQKSTDLCKKKYIKTRVSPESYLDIYRKSRQCFDNRQLYALQALFEWRDKTARDEDESYGYVLPNHMMLQISESLPGEMQGILACCNPIPYLVRVHLHAIHLIVLKAREQPLVKRIVNDDIVIPFSSRSSINFYNKLNCPYEFSYDQEFRDDLPTVLGPIKYNEDYLTEEFITTPSILSKNYELECNKNIKTMEKIKKSQFISPYQRYRAMIPLIEKQTQEEIAKEEELRNKKILCPIKNEKTIVIKTEEVENPYKLPHVQSSKRKKNDNKCPEIISKKLRTENAEKSKESKNTPNEDNSYPNYEKNNETSRINRIRPGKNYKSKKTHQSSDQPIEEFDYSKVDFNKFKGGSQKNQQTQASNKSNSKAGIKKINNKKFNKLFTFTKPNKK